MIPMSEMIITLLAISTSLLLFIAGLFLNKKGIYISGMGAGLLIIIGASMLFSPIQMEIGENSTFIYGENYSDQHWDQNYPLNPSENTVRLFHENKVRRFQDMDPSLNYSLSITFILLGLAGILFVGEEFSKTRYSD